ncbi:MAG: DUF2007 domain-containing protein [Acidobacteria bacterium]|nr:DUF2007 domain-containing protein [Acidobacteriota bacterium]
MGIGLIVFGIVLEALVLAGILDTLSIIQRAPGGDIVTFTDDMVVSVNGVPHTFARGTYKLTPQGFVHMRWYWLYRYGPLSIPSPLVLVGVGLWLMFRKPPGEEASEDVRVWVGLDLLQAKMLEQMLLDNGIECFSDRSGAEVLPAAGLGEIGLWVSKAQEERARTLLKAMEEEMSARLDDETANDEGQS